MARRDNQGIQIAMIVFILTTLLFMVTTYFGYSSTTSLKGELAKANSELSGAQGQMGSAESLATDLKTAVGIDPTTDDAGTRSRITELTTQYGQGLLPEQQNLIGIIQERSKRVSDLAQQFASATKQLQELRVEKDDALAAKEKELEDAKSREAAAHEGFSRMQKEKNDYIAENKVRNDGLVDATNKMKVDLEKAVTNAAKQIAGFEKQRDDAIRRVQMKQDELNVIKKDTPDQYDGRVLGVVAATKTVLLDVGSADAIRPKTTFRIYDADDTNVRTAKRKATVEVTRVLGAHRCEARITDADYIHPIVRNDYIYSPIWSPGTRLGIALVGKMDVDHDGLDDRERIRNFVEMNGGRIDAEDVDGKMVGSMTVNTRYVVIGEGELDGSVNEMLRLAKDLTIERMSVTELLDLMSPPGGIRGLAYDGGSKLGDSASKTKDGTTPRTSTGSSSFRKRTPLRRRDYPSRTY